MTNVEQQTYIGLPAGAVSLAGAVRAAVIQQTFDISSHQIIQILAAVFHYSKIQ